MKPLDRDSIDHILDILHRVPDLTLATLRPDGFPQATVVSYAHDGLTLYVGIGLDSQKAHNIRQDQRVSLTITCPYHEWHEIKGLSMAGTAQFVDEAQELQRVRDCMLQRFPQLKSDAAGTIPLPWTGAIFVRITPTIISLLDYTKGFGHTELFSAS